MIRLNFKTWDKKYTYKYIYKRIWVGGFWTPFVKINLRQNVIDFK